MADAGFVELPPGKFLAGVLLAVGRDIRMGEYAISADTMPRDDVMTERDNGLDLLRREVPIAEVMAGIDDLDADRARIDVGRAFPGRGPGMLGAARFGHELHDATVLENEIVARDLGRRIAEAGERFLGGFGAGVMKQQEIRRRDAAALAEIGRGGNLGGCKVG
jgi:hypothetical protein